MGSIPEDLGHKAWNTLGVKPSQGTITYTLSHYKQFRDASQPTEYVFGLGEDTGIPREIHQSIRRKHRGI